MFEIEVKDMKVTENRIRKMVKELYYMQMEHYIKVGLKEIYGMVLAL